jgi:S1-C subfamily serine protease
MVLILTALACHSAPAQAEYSTRQCTSVLKQISAALRGDAFEHLVPLSREYLTYCRHVMDTEEYAGALTNLAMGLNGIHQYSEALAVANQCLQIKPGDFGCFGEQTFGLFSLKRLREAKAAAEKGLQYPAITELDVKNKSTLRSLLKTINLALQNQSTQPTKRETATSGSAFFVSDAGHIVTNSHVVNDCRSLTAGDGTPLKYIRSNPTVDLALLQAPEVKPSAVATFRQSDVVLGESIIVFGFPLTGLLSTGGNVTTGTVSATTGMRDDPGNLQITAPIQPGNSGGPLLDQTGNVVGMVVAKLDAIKTTRITGDIPQNVNFAIKGREIIAFVNQANIAPIISTGAARLATETIAASAASFTIRVVCR